MTNTQRTVTPPSGIARLPLTTDGYPIPYFVANRGPSADFQVTRKSLLVKTVVDRRCWVCGQPRDDDDTFIVGPMCAVNRVCPEPPAHLACAEYSLQTCPFLTRDPGVNAAWTSPEWTLNRVEGGGWLFGPIGEPAVVSWWTAGRAATRAEVLAAIDAGMPVLRQMCETPDDHAVLDAAHHRAIKLAPPT